MSVEAVHPIDHPIGGMVRMFTGESEVLRLAREMIKRHGMRAGLRATERLNDRIDEGDWRGRDVWARVAHAVHELQRAEAGMPSTNELWLEPYDGCSPECAD